MYTLANLKEDCEEYLITKPHHRWGFCWWARFKEEVDPGEEVYTRVSVYLYEYRVMHPEIGLSGYVTQDRGCVPERLEFVRWMLRRVRQDIEEQKP